MVEYPDNRRCLQCKKLKPIEDFQFTHPSSKNTCRTYRRRVCRDCTHIRNRIRGFKQREEKREATIKWLFRELVRARRAGRLHQARAGRIMAAITKLCGGRAVDVAIEWKKLCDREKQNHPTARLTAEFVMLPVAIGLFAEDK